MGRPMCQRMVQAGFAVTGYDPDPEARRRTAECGMRPLSSPQNVARESDMVIIAVGFDKQVEAVIFGESGILAGANSGLVVGLASTVSPTYARGLPGRVAGHGVHLLDMPLTRSDRAAESGTLLVMGGGDAAIFDLCRPVLATFATDIFNLGAFGNGQIGKMVNNMILWACMAANDEGLRLGEQLGVDQESLRSALVVSSAANFPLIERSETRPIPWAEKDMAIAQHESDQIGFGIPLSGLVKELIKSLKRRRGYDTPSL
jgi:3-hydroxyisobutyrate dehydrogenase-like beta-hydroxyacid dehydrogenase